MLKVINTQTLLYLIWIRIHSLSHPKIQQPKPQEATQKLYQLWEDFFRRILDQVRSILMMIKRR